ncbi:MAG: hypothetical protein QOI59_4678 [Gammaproteobacteria bacterium]|nr:hypothetical protein [Gammaproteobacteria bacterium]
MKLKHDWVAAIALAAALPVAAQEKADLLLYHGKVLTVDTTFSIKSTLVVKDGGILAVGGDELVQRYTAATKVDLGGRVLMPGFMDTHLHITALARNDIEPDKAKSIADIQRMLRSKAKELGPGEWITGYGWDEAQLAEKRNLTRDDLDVTAPHNPVSLVRAGGHSSVGNSMALKIAGIDRNTPDPEFGLIEHTARGEPNGIIRERNDLYWRHVPQAHYEDLRSGYIASLKRLLALGITSFESATTTIDDEPVDQGGIAHPGSALTDHG